MQPTRQTTKAVLLASCAIFFGLISFLFVYDTFAAKADNHSTISELVTHVMHMPSFPAFAIGFLLGLILGIFIGILLGHWWFSVDYNKK